MTKQICVGKIAQAHGVKGLVKILPFCEDLGLIEQVKDFKITLKNPLGKYILAEIEGLNSREDVEAVKGTDLYIPRASLPDIEEDGRYYYEDLVGLAALSEGGEEIGRVLAMHDFGAGDLLEIKPKTGESYLVPFQSHVKDVSEDGVTIIPMEAVD